MESQRENETFTLQLRPRQLIQDKKKRDSRYLPATHMTPIAEDDDTETRGGIDAIMKDKVEVQTIKFGPVMEDEGSGMLKGPIEEESSDKENQEPEVDEVDSDDETSEEGEISEDDELGQDRTHSINWTTEGFFLVADDFSEIFDPKTKSHIPMPADPKAKRIALLKIFVWFSKLSYFASHKINMVPLFQKVPEKLWNSLITSEETDMLIRVQENKLLNDILARLTAVIMEWQRIGCYPIEPKSRADVELARAKAQVIRRRQCFTLLLLPKTTETDAWIRHIFGSFKGTVALNIWLDPTLTFRKTLVDSIALLAELHFVEITIRRAETTLAFNESIETMIGSIVHFNASHFN